MQNNTPQRRWAALRSPSSRRSVAPVAGAYRALRGVTATVPSSRRAVTPRNGRDKPARCPLTTNIDPFPATHQSGFPSVPSHNEAANKKVPIIAYMLSLAITTIIELFCLAPRSHWIPYRSTPLGCIRLLSLSASLQRRAACPQAGAVAFVACSYRRKPTNAPAASSRAESPRPRIGFYYRLWLRTAPQRAALLQSTALRPSRHAAREKAGRAGRAGTKAAIVFLLCMVAGRYAPHLTMLAEKLLPPFFRACLITLRRLPLILTGNVATALRCLDVAVEGFERRSALHTSWPTSFHC